MNNKIHVEVFFKKKKIGRFLEEKYISGHEDVAISPFRTIHKNCKLTSSDKRCLNFESPNSTSKPLKAKLAV
jgi:hypothetical protein